MNTSILRFLFLIFFLFGQPSYTATLTPVQRLSFYLKSEKMKAQVKAKFEQKFSKPFSKFTDSDYRSFLNGLNLTTNKGLMAWSAVTEIYLLAGKFRANGLHFSKRILKESYKKGVKLGYYTVLDVVYNYKKNQVEVSDHIGKVHKRIKFPPGYIMRTQKFKSGLANKNFSKDKVYYPALKDELLLPSELKHLKGVATNIKKVPLKLVKAMKGKAIYLSLYRGRSKAYSRTLRNRKNLASHLVPGVLYNKTKDKMRFIHELCHVLEETVIENKWKKYYYPIQFPQVNKLKTEKRKLFRVRGRDYYAPGFISNYARRDRYEDFAEHCAYFILKSKDFIRKAAKEKKAGNGLLLKKYHFFQKLFTKTSFKSVNLPKLR